MCILLLAVLIQTPSQPQGITVPPAPRTVFPGHGAAQPTVVQHLASPGHQTTPTLRPSSEEMIHIEMAKDISGHSEAIGDLKNRVGTLEEKREKSDRPDIDSLKSTRLYGGWVLSICGIALGILWWAKGFLWRDTVRPWLKSSLNDAAPSKETVPPSQT